ncbi:MAG: universal stress protein [Nocardioidaceae bacterium]
MSLDNPSGLDSPAAAPSRTTPSPTTPSGGEPTVVVGVDGSVANLAALAWATHEAQVSGRTLQRVSVGSEESLRSGDPSSQVTVGEPSRALVRAATGQAMLVVGKRGVGSLRRAVLGSTSIAVAGRSSVTVVVVPHEWTAATAANGPIVVGIDGTERDSRVLEFAFKRARSLQVPLEVVCSWQVPPLYAWSVEDVGRWEASGTTQLAGALRPLMARFPDVVVHPSSPTVDPAEALLATAGSTAQLVVLGRHSGPRHPGGLALGGTARRVLHHSRCPVAIVVAEAGGADADGFEESHVPEL